ncbi:MAG: response regulator transcription factor [Firmicutes bacterium]|nr:response regulator transcription factor [Bacillota bacterium]
MINIAVCDDDPSMLKNAANIISEYMKSEKISFTIAKFLDGESLSKSNQHFDLVFLDIQMAPPNGIETARCLRNSGFEGVIVFITVLKEAVFESFEVQAFDYVVKPFEKERLLHVLKRALNFIDEKSAKNLIVKSENLLTVVPFSSIIYCEVLGRKIYIHQIKDETTKFYGRFSELEKRFDNRFFKCHRSFIVNLDYVQSCGKGLVTLKNGSCVPASRLRERDLAQSLLLRMKERV